MREHSLWESMKPWVKYLNGYHCKLNQRHDPNYQYKIQWQIYDSTTVSMSNRHLIQNKTQKFMTLRKNTEQTNDCPYSTNTNRKQLQSESKTPWRKHLNGWIFNYVTDVDATPPRRRKTQTQVPKTEDCANHFSRNKTPPTTIKHKPYSQKATLNSRLKKHFEWENRHPIWTYQNLGCWR